jgi:hypothetical protein
MPPQRRLYTVSPYQTEKEVEDGLKRIADLVCRHRDPPLEVARRFADHFSISPRKRLRLFRYIRERIAIK